MTPIALRSPHQGPAAWWAAHPAARTRPSSSRQVRPLTALPFRRPGRPFARPAAPAGSTGWTRLELLRRSVVPHEASAPSPPFSVLLLFPFLLLVRSSFSVCCCFVFFY